MIISNFKNIYMFNVVKMSSKVKVIFMNDSFYHKLHSYIERKIQHCFLIYLYNFIQSLLIIFTHHIKIF